MRKGYTGEGFLSAGQTLGGSGGRAPPLAQMRELARANAEKRRAQGALFSGSGQKLGGTPTHLLGSDLRRVIADQATRRKAISTGCASGSRDAIKLSQQAESNAFSTKAEEDDANNLAISRALQELMEQEEDQKLSGTFEGSSPGGGLAWSTKKGLYNAGPSQAQPNGRHDQPSEEEQLKWAMEDSMRCAGQSLSKIGAGQHALPGHRPSSHDTDLTVSPVDSDRIMTPGDGDRSAPPEDLGCTASLDDPAANPVDVNHRPYDLTRNDRAKDPSRKRKHHKGRSDSSASPAHPSKQERIIKESSEAAQRVCLSTVEPSAGDDWACEICTCINPLQFLACDACGVERPQAVLLNTQAPKRKPSSTRVIPAPSREWKATAPARNESLGWNCRCGAFMEHRWWTCSLCGTLKTSS